MTLRHVRADVDDLRENLLPDSEELDAERDDQIARLRDRVSHRMTSLAILNLCLRMRFVQASLILRKSTRKRRRYVVELSKFMQLETRAHLR